MGRNPQNNCKNPGETTYSFIATMTWISWLNLWQNYQTSKQILLIWSEISHGSVPENVRNIKEQLIWNNRFIRINQKRIIYKTLCGAGAIRLDDLFFE